MAIIRLHATYFVVIGVGDRRDGRRRIGAGQHGPGRAHQQTGRQHAGVEP
jgi:hypothetical protein